MSEFVFFFLGELIIFHENEKSVILNAGKKSKIETTEHLFPWLYNPYIDNII